MAITYNWSILSLKKQNTTSLSDVIVEVQWQLKGTDTDDIFGEYTNTQIFDITTIGDGFISYSDLTEEMVIQWIKDIVWVDLDSSEYTYVDSIIGSIEHQIQQKKSNLSSIINTELPWAPEPEPIYVEPPLPDPPRNEQWGPIKEN
jgi:hypothetical protein